MTKEFIQEQIASFDLKAGLCLLKALDSKNDNDADKHEYWDNRSAMWKELAEYLSQHPVMQEGEQITSLLNPHEEDMIKLNQIMKDKPEGGSMFVRGDGLLPSMQWSWIAATTPRTSQDDDFGAHKSNVL